MKARFFQRHAPSRVASPASATAAPAVRAPMLEPMSREDFERSVFVLELTPEEADRECARLNVQPFHRRAAALSPSAPATSAPPAPCASRGAPTAPEHWSLV
jgi:hypothetical protein